MLSVACSPCGKWIASGGGHFDNTVRIWDASTGAAVGSPLRGHSRDNPECTCNHGPYEANPQCPVRGHSSGVSSVAFNQEGTLLASSCNDKTVKIWDPVSGEEKCTLRGHSKDNPECTCKHGEYSFEYQADPQCPVRGHRYVPFPCIECLLL